MGLLEFGLQNLAKYQDESTNVSNVSVSLVASFWQLGHFTFFHVGCMSRGLPGILKSTSSGNLTGKSSLDTSWTPQSSQWIMGIGQPQYLCLETPQSRKRYVVFLWPWGDPSILFFAILLATISFAFSIVLPFKKSELKIIPFPV